MLGSKRTGVGVIRTAVTARRAAGYRVSNFNLKARFAADLLQVETRVIMYSIYDCSPRRPEAPIVCIDWAGQLL